MNGANSWTDLGELTPAALQERLDGRAWPGDAGNCRAATVAMALPPGNAGHCRVATAEMAVSPGVGGNCRVVVTV